MVHASAAAHGIFFEGAETRGRLSCISDFGMCPRDCVDVFARQGCDTAHAAEKIQGNAFSGENGAGVSHNAGCDRILPYGVPVADLGVERNIGVEELECGLRNIET